MKVRNLCQAMLLAAAGTLAATAYAQTSPPASPQGSAAATKPAPAKTGHSGRKSSTHRATHAKHSRMTQPRPQAESPAPPPADSPYRTALRRCVEGPQGQRESCLDDVIARFNKS